MNKMRHRVRLAEAGKFVVNLADADNFEESLCRILVELVCGIDLKYAVKVVLSDDS